MVAGEAGPSKVNSESNNDNDTNDTPVKRHCKPVVAEPDRLVSIRNFSVFYIYLLKPGADVFCYTYVNKLCCMTNEIQLKKVSTYFDSQFFLTPIIQDLE